MNLNLATVRTVLRQALGHDAFVASFIQRVHVDTAIATAGITPDGLLSFNPTFVEQHIKTQADLFCLVFHEVLHPAFSHFMHGQDRLANVGCDAIINAIIAQVYSGPSGHGQLFAQFYPDRGMEAILRPGSHLVNSRFGRLYGYLYPSTKQTASLSSGEVIQALRALTPTVPLNVVLLGTHDKPGTWPKEVLGRINQDLLSALSSGTAAGASSSLASLLISVLKGTQSIQESLLSRYATDHRVDRFFAIDLKPRRCTSPLPLNPSRRDMTLLSAGVWPATFRNSRYERREKQQGIAVYLDVSGSVSANLATIIGLLNRYRERLASIYLFSNAVIETDMRALCGGQITTTWGTDFDCVALSILEHRYRQAVIITDGYASLQEDNGQALTDQNTRILTILFGTKTTCPEFEPHGDVVQLRDVIETHNP